MSGIRVQPQQGKDRIRLSTQEKQAAVQAAGEKKQQYDDPKLLKLLRAAKNELTGLRLIHLHLSLLRDKDATAQTIVRTVVNEMASKASYLQTFALSNGDVICLYKGLKLSAVTEVCQKIEMVFLSKTVMVGRNPYNEQTLYSIMELSLNFVGVMRFIEELRYGESENAELETKPPITLEEMARLERSIPSFDLSPFLFNQPIVDMSSTGSVEEQFEFFELYISIRALQERLCPNFDVAANRWLFNYFTVNLDQSVLRALGHGLSFMRSRRVSLNINLSSVMSAGFVKFDERLPIDYRGNIILEINKSDVVENHTLFMEVVEFAADKKYQIAIDGLTPFWATSFDFERLNCNYAKIFWTSDMLDMDEEFRDNFVDHINSQRSCRFVLSRCDTISSMLFAKECGIRLVQGRAVDNILRKGVTVHEAIGAAVEIRRD